MEFFPEHQHWFRIACPYLRFLKFSLTENRNSEHIMKRQQHIVELQIVFL